jgi:hypothetical protein
MKQEHVIARRLILTIGVEHAQMLLRISTLTLRLLGLRIRIAAIG